MASMSEVELSWLNIRINTMKQPHIAICVFFLNPSSSGRFRMSTQKQVVREVRAESALENEAATIPMVKNIITTVPE